MSRPLLAAVLLASSPLALPAGAQSRVEPGEWEQVMTITAPDSPGMPAPGPIRQCITSAEVAIFADRDRWAQEIANANPNAKCRVQEAKQDGTALSVVLACEGDMLLKVRHDFQGRTGTIDAESLVGGVPKFKNHIESRKVADTCSAESIELWKRQNPGKPFAP
jgi:hypothetical protein